MKRLNKVLSVLFLFLLVCSSCLPFAAAEDLDTPVNEDISVDLQYISIANCNLTIVNGTAHISSIVSGTPGSTTKCKITLSLQQKSLLWWSTVESWKKTELSYQTTLNASYSVVSGKTYRAIAVVTVWNGINSETTTVVSHEIKAT